MFPDGWICRACWKPNRPGDDRCYVCKTPREEQLVVEAGSLKERAKPGFEKRGRLDSDLGIVAGIVAWPMWLSGVLGIIGGAFILFLALIAGDRVDTAGTSVRLVLLITAVVIILFSMLWIFVSRSVRRQARWAYAIAILVYGVPGLVALLWSVPLPSQVELPAWYGVAETIFEWLYLVLGLMAVMLLAASFMRSDDEAAEGRTSGAPT